MNQDGPCLEENARLGKNIHMAAKGVGFYPWCVSFRACSTLLPFLTYRFRFLGYGYQVCWKNDELCFQRTPTPILSNTRPVMLDKINNMGNYFTRHTKSLSGPIVEQDPLRGPTTRTDMALTSSLEKTHRQIRPQQQNQHLLTRQRPNPTSPITHMRSRAGVWPPGAPQADRKRAYCAARLLAAATPPLGVVSGVDTT